MAPPKSKSADPIPTSAVKALVPVNYDGTMYGPGLPDGDTFDCRQPDLQQLLDVNAVDEVQAAEDAAS
jgi:hypothetical protein